MEDFYNSLFDSFNQHDKAFSTTTLQSNSSSRSPISFDGKKVIRKVRWTPEEDEILLEAVKELGTDCWAQVASRVQGRTGKQCREHYVLTLDPSFSRKAFTKDDDIKIVQLQKMYGNQWAKISIELGRAPTAVKNRFKLIKQRNPHLLNSVRDIEKKVDMIIVQKPKEEEIDISFFDTFDPESLFETFEESFF